MNIQMNSISSTGLYPKGVMLRNGILHICLEAEGDNSVLNIFDVNKNPVKSIEFKELNRLGRLYFGDFTVGKTKTLLYTISKDDKRLNDLYMRDYEGDCEFGFPVEAEKVFYKVKDDTYEWEQDTCPNISYSDSIFYLMHVRGFTMHSSSKVKGKGTFRGVAEKADYLKDLGVTGIEMMPVCSLKATDLKPSTYGVAPSKTAKKLNYWGYQECFYYCLNKNLSYSKDSSKEFKDMVKELHSKGLEVILQFYFPNEVKRIEIIDILTFWKQEYHVDGFHLKGDNIPKIMIAEDSALKDCKIIYDFLDDYELGDLIKENRFASYTEDYMYDMRRFLKGDEGLTEICLRYMRGGQNKAANIRYFTNYSGFTLKDLVSYERKHNEDNGENNLDGNDYNLSWNCGAEGETRKTAITNLRTQQIKNALTLLFTTNAAPLIYMGDEFGNSQKGNNNPYCQDNEITRLNWNDSKKNQAIYDFAKKIISIRREYKCLHPNDGYRMMDTISCGYPDLSYHGEEAWKPDLYSYNRHVGLLYCRDYEGKKNSYLYLAINMHWEEHSFALPNMPKGLKWKEVISTGENRGAEVMLNNFEEESKITLVPRSILILETEGNVEVNSADKKRKKK